MNEGIERRAWPVELRAEGTDEVDVIRGYAAVFDQLSEDLGGFRERIAPGAFRRSVESGDVRALWEHNPQYVLGRTRAGTLEMAEDARGLRVVIRPPDTVWAGDLRRSLERGDVNQMSFGFTVRDEAWDQEDGVTVRTLKDVDVFDVSIVTFPAYPQTSAEARDKAAAVAQAGGAAEENSKRARARARRAARQRTIDLFEVMK